MVRSLSITVECRTLISVRFNFLRLLLSLLAWTKAATGWQAFKLTFDIGISERPTDNPVLRTNDNNLPMIRTINGTTSWLHKIGFNYHKNIWYGRKQIFSVCSSMEVKLERWWNLEILGRTERMIVREMCDKKPDVWFPSHTYVECMSVLSWNAQIVWTQTLEG